jgi:hypothetical protein
VLENLLSSIRENLDTFNTDNHSLETFETLVEHQVLDLRVVTNLFERNLLEDDLIRQEISHEFRQSMMTAGLVIRMLG